MTSTAKPWFVYVLVSTVSEHTYVGIALDPAERLLEHNGDKPGGAKYTRAHRPWAIGRIYGPVRNRSEACKLEHQIKKEVGKARLLVEWEPE